MAGKKAVVFLLDCGCTMKPHLPEALDLVKGKMLQLMLASKTHEVGLITFGVDSNDTNNQLASEKPDQGYEGICEFMQLERTRGEMLRRLKDVKTYPDSKGDLLSALVVAHHALTLRTAKKKYERHIYVITDCCTEVEDPSDLRKIVAMHKEDGREAVVHLVLCGGSRVEERRVKEEAGEKEEGEEGAYDVKLETEKMMRSIAKVLKGKALCVEPFIKQLANEVSTSTPQKVKIDMTLGTKLTLKCVYFKRNAASTLDPLKKESRASRNEEEKDSGKVVNEKTYRDPEDPTSELEFTKEVRGFPYGKTCIPFTDTDQDAMHLAREEAAIKIIGFVGRGEIPQNLFLSEAHVLCGQTTTNAKGVAALSRAMQSSSMVAIARILKRTSEKPNPLLSAIFPDDSKSVPYDRLLFVQLPFARDLRDFTFPSFKKASSKDLPDEEQLKVAEALVESMMLPPLPTDDPIRAGLMPNPWLIHYRDAVVARIMDKEAAIPPMSEQIKALINVESGMLSTAQPAFSAFSQRFPLKKSEATAKNRPTHFFSDEPIAQGSLKVDKGGKGEGDGKRKGDADDEGVEESKEGGEEQAGGASKKQKTAADVKISAEDPVEDFNRLVSESALPLPSLLQQLEGMVAFLVEEGQLDSQRRKAVKCCVALRATCEGEARKRKNKSGGEPDEGGGEGEVGGKRFNSFMQGVKAKYARAGGAHEPFWAKLVEAGVGLLSKEEDEEVKESDEQVKAFLEAEEEAPGADATQALPTAMDEDQDDDDAFD